MLAASSKAETLPLFPTHFLGEVGIDWGTMAAASAFIMLPALIVVFAMQKAMVRGLTRKCRLPCTAPCAKFS